MMKIRSFSLRLSLNVILATSLLLLVVIGVVAVYSYNLITAEATRSATNMLQATINGIEKELRSVETAVEGSRWLAEENLGSAETAHRLPQKIVRSHPTVVGSAMAYAKDSMAGQHWFAPYAWKDAATGELKTRLLGGEDYDYFYMDWFLIPALTKQATWTEPYYDDGGGEQLMCTYALPLAGEDGSVACVLTADISLDQFSDRIKKLRPYPHADAMLISRNGTVIAGSAMAGANATLGGDTIFSLAEGEAKEAVYALALDMVNGRRGVRVARGRGEKWMAVYGPLSNGWSAVIICPYSEVLAEASQMYLIITLVALCSLTVLFLLCYFSIRRLTQPLRAFSQAAGRIAEGDFNTALPVIRSRDEIYLLRRSFEHMQSSLTQYIENLKTTMAEKHRYESELSIAHDIQQHLLPTDFVNNAQLELHAAVLPAKEVGGDLYDFVPVGNRLFFSVGDVSGKGVSAALIMAMTRSAFHHLGALGLTLEQIMAHVNDTLSQNNESAMFVTLFAGCLNLDTGELEFCNAGHNAPVVVPQEGEPYFLHTESNICLGILPGYAFVPQRFTLPAGAKLVLYTDGVTEAERADRSQFGDARLLAWLNTHCRREGAAATVKELLAELHRFADGQEQSDDITLMTLYRK